MKKTICLFMIGLLTLCACSNNDKQKEKPMGCDDDPICEVGKNADMSSYENFDDENHKFIETPMSDFLLKLDAEATAVYYFGYSTCPWCIEAVPIMNEVAKAHDLSIYYIDKKAETSDETSIAAIEERLADILEKDENGNPHLYVPFVVVIKDGEIVAHHMGTVDDHDAHERKMTENEQKQLKEIYEAMFAKIND